METTKVTSFEISSTFEEVSTPWGYLQRALRATVGTYCGSLAVPLDTWQRFLMAPTLDAATALVVEATPEEGDIHPARATVGLVNEAEVEIRTPGGVTVTVWHGEDAKERPVVCVNVDFNRPSSFLALQCAGALAQYYRGQAYCLAQAALDNRKD